MASEVMAKMDGQWAIANALLVVTLACIHNTLVPGGKHRGSCSRTYTAVSPIDCLRSSTMLVRWRWLQILPLSQRA